MAAPINPLYPVADVRTEAELMDIAVGMEHEAARRYGQLAEIMRRRKEPELAKTFADLAELEQHHEAGLTEWAERDGLATPKPAQFTWRLPETFAVEDADNASLSPYQALAIAVRNEEQAFAFYTYLAAQGHTKPEVRKRAEAMAREELNHCAQLRRLRRKAFRAQRGGRPDRAAAVFSLSGLHRLAWGMEQGSADLAMMGARWLEKRGNASGALLLRHAGTEAERRAQSYGRLVGSSAQAPASTVVEHARGDGLLTGEPAPEALLLCERDAMEVLEIYLSVAERAKTEVMLHTAQDLANGAVARLALIRSQLPDSWSTAEG